jgi:acyl-CoA synthetase (AMP-forming)/AMP-acid ligase II
VAASRGESSLHATASSLQHWLSCSAALAGDKVALVCGPERLTYRVLDERSSALAAGLESRGVEHGDRVLVFADNTPETVVAFWAVLKARAVVCLVNPLTKAGKLLRLIEDCRPAVLITDAHLHKQWAGVSASAHLKCVIYSGRLGDAERARLPDAVEWQHVMNDGGARHNPAGGHSDADLAALVYAAGPSGEPLGVMLTHGNMRAATESIGSCLDLVADDVVLCALPLSSEHGLYPMIAACRAGARLVLERSFAFPGEVLRRMAAERVTAFPAVPAILGILASLKKPGQYDLSAVRTVASAGAGLPTDAIELLGRWFPRARVYSTYGMSECGRCAYLPPADVARKAGSVGIEMPGMALRIVDSDGLEAASGVAGELVVSGAAVMSGYWEKPVETARALAADRENGSQVLATGAGFRRDDEGYLYFVSRLDGLLECRGERVAPREIEAVVRSVDGVREAAVVGVPDAVLGAAVKVFVVLEPGAAVTDKDVLRACVGKLENHMVPKFVEITSELPETLPAKVSA